MSQRNQIGEFEHLALSAILHLGESAYALPIRRKIEELGSRKVSRICRAPRHSALPSLHRLRELQRVVQPDTLHYFLCIAWGSCKASCRPTPCITFFASP